MKEDFSWFALHSGIQNKITTTLKLQHSYCNTTKLSLYQTPELRVLLVASSWSSRKWCSMVSAKVLCRDIMCELTPGSPPPFLFFYRGEGRAWEWGYCIDAVFLNVTVSGPWTRCYKKSVKILSWAPRSVYISLCHTTVHMTKSPRPFLSFFYTISKTLKGKIVSVTLS